MHGYFNAASVSIPIHMCSKGQRVEFEEEFWEALRGCDSKDPTTGLPFRLASRSPTKICLLGGQATRETQYGS